MFRNYLLALVISTLASGCASIVNGQNQTISIDTPGCKGATCELNNDKGKWYIAATPGSVTVNRSFADLFVKCTKSDWPPVIESVHSKTKGMAFGNIIFGGVIGAGIDIANGSAYDYPIEINLPLACDGPNPNIASAPMKLGCKVKELTEVEGGVKGLATTQGVLVTSVESSGLAEAAGIHQGDVLVGFNEVEITNSIMLKDLLLRQDRQQPFRIRYFRQGEFGWAEFNTTRGNL